MGDNNDESKYLEGNYSANNPFKAVKEWWEDTKQAQELENAEEYFEAYMQYLKDKKDEHHYLVDGSVLTCTRCTMKPQTPIDKEFTAPEGSNEVILKVTMQDRYKNAAEQLFATIKDSKKFDNIEPFGNCLNPPDRDDERKALELAGESEELRKLGTCRYLMQLNDEWENLISDVGYQEVTGLDNISLEEITMESILFCKHGGFIYPIDSGYITSENTDEMILFGDEMEFAQKFGLTEEQCVALIDIRKYFEEYPELMEKTTIFAFEGLGTIFTDEKASSWNGTNTYHPNGQFGAIFIVTKEGKLSYALTNASTLPDNMAVSATVCEGIYRMVSTKHKSNQEDGYAAVQLRDFDTYSSTLPAYNSKNEDDYASGINLHMAGLIVNDDAVYSTGCITVPVNVYREFGVEVGFIQDLESNKNAGSDGIYRYAKADLKYDDNAIKDFEGCIVIDRSYYEDGGEYLKYNGPKAEEGK